MPYRGQIARKHWEFIGSFSSLATKSCPFTHLPKLEQSAGLSFSSPETEKRSLGSTCKVSRKSAFPVFRAQFEKVGICSMLRSQARSQLSGFSHRKLKSCFDAHLLKSGEKRPFQNRSTKTKIGPERDLRKLEQNPSFHFSATEIEKCSIRPTSKVEANPEFLFLAAKNGKLSFGPTWQIGPADDFSVFEPENGKVAFWSIFVTRGKPGLSGFGGLIREFAGFVQLAKSAFFPLFAKRAVNRPCKSPVNTGDFDPCSAVGTFGVRRAVA